MTEDEAAEQFLRRAWRWLWIRYHTAADDPDGEEIISRAALKWLGAYRKAPGKASAKAYQHRILGSAVVDWTRHRARIFREISCPTPENEPYCTMDTEE